MSEHDWSAILPLPAPEDPLPLIQQWLEQATASGRQRNPDAMALATADAEGRPSVRMVLMRTVSVKHGYAVFYTHYGSRKGLELERNPRAAGVLYWEQLGRQVRFEGRVVRSPEAESDRYFAGRPWHSQLNAWASVQSLPLGDPQELASRARRKAAELGADARGGTRKLPRPPHWGGYRLWFEAVELWAEGADRFHDRIRYERTLHPDDAFGYIGSAWSHRRLQP